MKKNLAFDTPQVEFSFGTGIFIRNLDIIKLSIYFHLVVNFFKIYSECADIHWIISSLRLIVALFVFSICMAILNLNKFESTYYIRLFLQIDSIINILIKTKIFYGHSLQVSPIIGNYNESLNGTLYNAFDEILNKTGEISISNNSLIDNSISPNKLYIGYGLKEISNFTNDVLPPNLKNLHANIQSK